MLKRDAPEEPKIRVVCPYCDSDDCRLRDICKVEERDDKVFIVREARCRECNEWFYALAVYKSLDKYVGYRRDRFEEETGIKIRRGTGRRR